MIECNNLVKIYKTKEIEVLALQGLDLQVASGEMVAIIGNSGSGKSTLLNMIGGLDKPSAGRLFVNGKDLFKMSDHDLVKYKRQDVGFIWQNNARNLIPYLNALENVELPMLINGKVNRKYAKELLEVVGLGKKMKNRLFELSGGEQQRVAIAISLANKPKVLLADEPTGAVDTSTAAVVIDAFRKVNKAYGTTVVIVTHDRWIASGVDRVIEIRDGRTSSEFIRKSDTNAADQSEGQYFASHEKYVVMDAAGRLQIPAEIMELAQINERTNVKVRYENGAIIITRK
ncbi:MAG TPA: ABC transporter ATP-binding protein [Clostridia bacterium]|nr:ABC transporter ATP-binding protein [Clostridia bacterium]